MPVTKIILFSLCQVRKNYFDNKKFRILHIKVFVSQGNFPIVDVGYVKSRYTYLCEQRGDLQNSYYLSLYKSSNLHGAAAICGRASVKNRVMMN